jgi:hypothetical protein
MTTEIVLLLIVIVVVLCGSVFEDPDTNDHCGES